MSDKTVYQFNMPLNSTAYEGIGDKYNKDRRGILEGDQNQLAAREIRLLIARSQHAFRNNSIAKAAARNYVTMLQDIKVIWRDTNRNTSKEMQEAWDEFAKNPMIDGYGSFATATSVINASQFITGSAFIRFHIRRKGNTNRIPLKLQHIPTYQHAIAYQDLNNNRDIKFGIEFDDFKPKTYFFDKPKNSITDLESFKPVEVPADEICHIFIRDTADQWIGVPELSAVLVTLYEIEDLTDATIARQKASQVVSWIIKKNSPIAMTPVGTPSAQINDKGEEKVVMKTTGTNVVYLNRNEDITQAQSADIGDNVSVLLKTELMKISAALGIPFHKLSGDTSGLDFSTIRALSVELRTRAELIYRYYLIPLFLDKVTTKFKDLADVYGIPVNNISPFYQFPRFRGVDDLKDAQADLLEIQSGLETWENILNERQLSFEDVIADRKKLEEAGLTNLLTPVQKDTKQATNNKPNSNSTGI